MMDTDVKPDVKIDINSLVKEVIENNHNDKESNIETVVGKSHNESDEVKKNDTESENDVVGESLSSTNNWCEVIERARATLDPSLDIKLPCEKMTPAKSAIAVYLTSGKPEGKGSRIEFTTSDYVKGVLAIGASLQDHLTRNDTHKLLLINEYFNLLPEDRARLEALGWIIGTPPHVQIENKYLPRYARYKTVYNKISVLGLAEYECALLLDADALVVDNIDDLMSCNVFDRPEYRAAGVLDYYHGKWYHANTGSILYRTSAEEMNRVYDLTKNRSFMTRFESDQIFINTVYPDRINKELNIKILNDGDAAREHWGAIAHLPFSYNAQTHCEYQIPNYWKEELPKVKILHYTEKKAWQCPEKKSPSEGEAVKIKDCRADPNCACLEAYRWYNYADQAYERTSKLNQTKEVVATGVNR